MFSPCKTHRSERIVSYISIFSSLGGYWPERAGGEKSCLKTFIHALSFQVTFRTRRQKHPTSRQEWLLNGSAFQSAEQPLHPGWLHVSFSEHLTQFRWLVESVTALTSRAAPSSLCRRWSAPERIRLSAAQEPGDPSPLCLGSQASVQHPRGDPCWASTGQSPGTAGSSGPLEGMLAQVSAPPLKEHISGFF